MTEEDLLHGDTYRDRVSTVTKDGSRNWVYALKPKGDLYQYRKYLAYIYLAVFFIMPFIKVNGLPFMMANVVEGKFILFSKIFWPQDFFIFAIGMIAFIVFIVLFTVIFGRIFCGWVCPQTVFLEFVFRPIEWLIEGSPSQQRKIDVSSDNSKYLKKVVKHLIYIAISFLIAHTFLSYVLGLDQVIRIIKEPLSEHLGLFGGLVVFTALFYSVFAFVREIVCTTICPYGRLQGVMVDQDTMQVSYDYKRGEPRARLKKSEVRTAGDCIDCFKCVQVCPTAIDIRDGVQMECVGCTACIDACDEVMDAIHLDRGLIRYASENEIAEGKKQPITTKIKAYSILLVILLIVMSGMIASRKSIDNYISRASGQLYHTTPKGDISNLFELKSINKTKDHVDIQLRVKDMDATVKFVGQDSVLLKPEYINTFSFFIEIPKAKVTNYSTTIAIEVLHDGQVIDVVKTNFIGPFN